MSSRARWVLDELRDGSWRTLNKGSHEELSAELLLRLHVDPDAHIELYEEQQEDGEEST